MFNAKAIVGLMVSIALSAGLAIGAKPDARARVERALARAETEMENVLARADALAGRVIGELNAGVVLGTDADIEVNGGVGAQVEAQAGFQGGLGDETELNANAGTEIGIGMPSADAGAGLETQIEGEAESDGLLGGVLRWTGRLTTGLNAKGDK